MSTGRLIVISMDDQKLDVIENGKTVATFDVSTAEKGMGFLDGSHRTPTGRFRISEKIGDGLPAGTIFKARKPVGLWRPGEQCGEDLVLTRILRLDGLDPENRNTLQRFVYIHGTNDEQLIGQPAGHGCVRLRNDDMIALFERVDENDRVEIHPATRRRGRLAFVAFDSMIVETDGVCEMARLRGVDTQHRVHDVLAAMRAGKIDEHAARSMWMNALMPDADLLGAAAARCAMAVSPAAADLLAGLEACGYMTVMISRSPIDVVMPVAGILGVRHVEAPTVNPGGARAYAYPCGAVTKSAVVGDWSSAMLPAHVLVMGSDVDDMATRPFSDLLVACGPAHPDCDLHIKDIKDSSSIIAAIEDIVTA